MTVLNGPTEAKEIGNVQGEDSFQGKCDRLSAVLFPANATTPEMPPSLIPTPQVSIVHSFDQLTPDDITVEVRGNTLSSVPGADNIPQAMVAAINNAMPEILAEIFT